MGMLYIIIMYDNGYVIYTIYVYELVCYIYIINDVWWM